MPINVNLTPELESLIRQKVSSGRYNSASEVVREALRLMEAEDQLRAAKLEQLRHDIQWQRKTQRVGNLAEFFAASPLRGSGLKIHRLKGQPRKIKL